MLFNSVDYILFLVIVFAGFWLVPDRRLARNALLLVASYLFYMSWNAWLILLIVASTLVDFFIGLALGRTDGPRARQALLWISLVVNLGMLGLFKYADFTLEAAAQISTLAGRPAAHEPIGWILPVGISFYTFQTLSYTIDVYRRRLEPSKSLVEFATYVSFFPQLIAGPIVRAKDFLPQLGKRPALSRSDVGEGLFLICKGLTKKVLVADYLGANFNDRVFAQPEAYSSGEVWFALFAYSWQLYCDFSGYTDIARGSGRLFGLSLPENFNRPYMATGPIEFWKRWHITLSTWIQDYLYIPLGGSRRGELRTRLNLFFTFVVMGIWHGAGWTFVCFGLWHATGVVINRAVQRWRGDAPLSPAMRGVAIFVFYAGFLSMQWPMFRSPDVATMLEVYRRMFSAEFTSMRIPPTVIALCVGMGMVHFSPPSWVDRARDAMVRAPAFAQAGIAAAVAALGLYISAEQAAPFVYFQF